MDLGYLKHVEDSKLKWSYIRIPFELLASICYFAAFDPPDYSTSHWHGIYDYDSLKSFRLVCKVFNAVGTPLLFSEVYLALTEESTRNLDNIMSNSGISKHVKTLSLDCYQYQDNILRQPEAVARRYVEHAYEESLVASSSDDKLLSGFKWLHGVLSYQENMRRRNIQVDYLCNVITSCPKLSGIVFTDGKPPYSLGKFSDEGIHGHIVDVSMDASKTLLVLQKYLNTLVQHASAQNFKSLSITGTCPVLKLVQDGDVFRLVVDEAFLGLLTRLHNVEIDLTLDDPWSRHHLVDRPTSEHRVQILQALLQAKDLRSLDLYLPHLLQNHNQRLAPLLFHSTLPTLQELHLSADGVDGEHLLRFLTQQPQLQHIELEIHLHRGSWYDIVTGFKKHGGGRPRLSHFALVRCAHPAYMSVGSAVMLDYLYGSGFCPVIKPKDADEIVEGSERSVAELERRMVALAREL